MVNNFIAMRVLLIKLVATLAWPLWEAAMGKRLCAGLCECVCTRLREAVCSLGEEGGEGQAGLGLVLAWPFGFCRHNCMHSNLNGRQASGIFFHMFTINSF